MITFNLDKLYSAMTNKNITYISIRIVLLSLFIAMQFISSGLAQENGEKLDSEAELTVAQDSGQADEFQYQLEGRPDPFIPFIEPKVATKIDPNEIVDDEAELTGMQLFEPGQLTLVAVMFSNRGKIAMVEDVTGKGYVVHEGILIGRHGVVSQINEEQVIITETAHTRAGKELVTTVVMRLNKEGDQ